jgi:hypothetical protein
MLFSATQARKIEDLARISLKKDPLYVGVDDKKIIWRGRHGPDRMVIEFTTTYAISAHHQLNGEFESRSWRGVLDTTYYMIKFLSDLQQVGIDR